LIEPAAIFPLSVKEGFFAAERIAVSNDGRDIYYSDVYTYRIRIDDIIDSIRQTIVIEKFTKEENL
jgi:hypothetical protein